MQEHRHVPKPGVAPNRMTIWGHGRVIRSNKMPKQSRHEEGEAEQVVRPAFRKDRSETENERRDFFYTEMGENACLVTQIGLGQKTDVYGVVHPAFQKMEMLRVMKKTDHDVHDEKR